MQLIRDQVPCTYEELDLSCWANVCCGFDTSKCCNQAQTLLRSSCFAAISFARKLSLCANSRLLYLESSLQILWVGMCMLTRFNISEVSRLESSNTMRRDVVMSESPLNTERRLKLSTVVVVESRAQVQVVVNVTYREEFTYIRRRMMLDSEHTPRLETLMDKLSCSAVTLRFGVSSWPSYKFSY